MKPGATAATTSGRIGIHVNDCDELVFSELHAEGAQAGVQWWNGGEATWTRVDMVATGNPAGGRDFTAGWFDSSDDLATTRSTHFLHDCRSSVSSNATPLRSQEAGYYTQAAETYFFGGVISAGPSIKPAKQNTVGVYVYNNSTFSAFDTQIVAKRESAGAFLISTDGVNVQAGSQGGARAFLQGVSILVRAPEPRNGVKVPGSGEVIQVDTTVDVAEQD